MSGATKNRPRGTAKPSRGRAQRRPRQSQSIWRSSSEDDLREQPIPSEIPRLAHSLYSMGALNLSSQF